MRNNCVCGALAAVALMAASERAYAATVQVDCSANSGALAAQFANGGTANTTYQITGPCNGNFSITQNQITIQGVGGTGTINNSAGRLFITGATNVLLETLTIGGGGVVVSNSAFVTILSSTISAGDDTGVLADGPTHVIIQSTNIGGNRGYGLWARHGAVIESTRNTVAGNGDAGVFAEGLAQVIIQDTNIGPNMGGGLVAFRGAVIESTNSTVTGGGGIVAELGSTVEFDYGSISSQYDEAIFAQGSSSVHLVETTVTGATGSPTILVRQGSSAYIEGSTITSDLPFSANNQFAVIAAEDTSSVMLNDDNTITNSAAGGAAVILSGGSTLKEGSFSGQNIGLISGDARIHTQSVIELGATPLPNQTMIWNGNIFLSQASSFRADGGNVTINGTLTLDQASNGYFNHFAGTSNNISSVVCKSATGHVSNPNFVTPPVTIGPPPGCALF